MYNEITESEFLNEVSNRLGDAGNIFWPLEELGRLLKEACYTWQAVSQQGIASRNLPVDSGRIIDLTQILPEMYELSEDVMSSVNDSLFETNVITEQFAEYVNQRATRVSVMRDWHRATRLITEFTSRSAGPDPVPLDDDKAGIIYAAWTPNAGQRTTTLHPVNTAIGGLRRTSRGMPLGYELGPSGENNLRLYPQPDDVGQVELLQAYIGAEKIPTTFSWAIKWGLLANLLMNDGQARDVVRLEYAQKRYKDSIAIAQEADFLKNFYVDENLKLVNSIAGLSSFDANWKRREGSTVNVGCGDWNTIILSPFKVDQGFRIEHYGLTVLPENNGGFLNIPRGIYEIFVDYVVHLAMFKVGGLEFTQTFSAYQRFLEKATEYNSWLAPLMPQMFSIETEKDRKVLNYEAKK